MRPPRAKTRATVPRTADLRGLVVGSGSRSTILSWSPRKRSRFPAAPVLARRTRENRRAAARTRARSADPEARCIYPTGRPWPPASRRPQEPA